MQQRVALVTGVSGGIGRAIAESLAGGGFRVFGTMRRPEGRALPNVELIALDVRSDESVSLGIERLMNAAGCIDLLVNNAGLALAGALEETSVAEASALFETNFFGVLRMTNAALPIMRAQGSGRIVTISSVGGFLPMPYYGIYAATKHALEAYSETLDHEVREFGVRSVLVEPSYVRTGLEQNAARAKTELDAYADPRRRASEAMREGVARGESPARIADIVLRAATSPRPRIRYLAGRGSLPLRLLRTWMPARIFEYGLRRHFGLR